jgi:hypothetical protein
MVIESMVRLSKAADYLIACGVCAFPHAALHHFLAFLAFRGYAYYPQMNASV